MMNKTIDSSLELIFPIKYREYIRIQGGRGHWTVNYSVTEVLLRLFFLFVGSKTFGNFVEL